MVVVVFITRLVINNLMTNLEPLVRWFELVSEYITIKGVIKYEQNIK